MVQGVIIKALSGFYYVAAGDQIVECKARGRFRYDGCSPLVGDRVQLSFDAHGKGRIEAVEQRRNAFIRPAVANIDQLIMIGANVNPITDPFLIDRVVAIAENAGCEPVVCLNKCDLDPAEHLYDIYRSIGFRVLRTSAATGLGLDALRDALRGKTSAFTGNSGVGKSSLLNALDTSFGIATGAVSERLGRGKHTTRHVELYALGEDTFVADTPGFASFEVDMVDPISCENLQYAFREFRPYIGKCRFRDCAHLKEPGCAVLAAVEAGEIAPERHESYARLYALSAQGKEKITHKRTVLRISCRDNLQAEGGALCFDDGGSASGSALRAWSPGCSSFWRSCCRRDSGGLRSAVRSLRPVCGCCGADGGITAVCVA